jgi:uncharacterized protein YndB with AHSA1/START domain
MTVISCTPDPESLTLTLTAEFDATPDQVWDVWADARKLERWWGPPTFPATFTRHDFTVGGESRYHMTGPGGETPRGWWGMKLIERPSRIEFDNGLAGDDGEPAPGVAPMPSEVTLEATENGTRLIAISNFVDMAQMEKMVGMGMPEGLAAAAGQIDAVLEEFAAA